MLKGQNGTTILQVENGVVRLCHDMVTCSYTIGIRTDKDFQWKDISKELYELMVKELSNKEGNRW